MSWNFMVTSSTHNLLAESAEASEQVSSKKQLVYAEKRRHLLESINT